MPLKKGPRQLGASPRLPGHIFRWHPKKVKSVFSVYFSTTPFSLQAGRLCCLGHALLVARWSLRDTLRLLYIKKGVW